MECIHCHGTLERGHTSYTANRKGYHLIIDHVPGWICKQCGETLFDEETVGESLKAVTELRGGGINAETYFDEESLRRQLTYANKKGIPFVILVGPDELKGGEVSVKEMESGEQKRLPRASLVPYLKERIAHQSE